MLLIYTKDTTAKTTWREIFSREVTTDWTPAKQGWPGRGNGQGILAGKFGYRYGMPRETGVLSQGEEEN